MEILEVTIGKTFTFDAAHVLVDHPGLCKNLHGHTYTLTVELTGQVNCNTHMLVDFYELKEIVKARILLPLDHTNISELYPQTTVEALSAIIASVISGQFPKFDVSIQLQEGTGGYARTTRKRWQHEKA